jgi:hypothetical protein
MFPMQYNRLITIYQAIAELISKESLQILTGLAPPKAEV